MATSKAIALCRVSTKKQRLEGSSLEAQELRVYECALYLDTEIEKLWSLDTSSRKGKNIAREDLKEMLAYVKQNKSIKYIIVDEADRFMRSVEEAFFWKVTFKSVGVTLAYAKMPEITHEDDPIAVMREMMAFFQAEMSNHERITKATDKMQAKIQAGYYPGMVHQGYKKSNVRSLHVPDEPKWSLLQTAMRKVLYDAYSLDEALNWLNANGYKLKGGGLLDMWKLKRIFKEPYYAGIIKMSNWDTICENGLHQPMITKEEHACLVDIVSGRRQKFKVHRYNPKFKASNIIECADCLLEGRRIAKLVGYSHHNNKPDHTRRYYERYRCRGCGKNVLKDILHEGLDNIFDNTELIVEDEFLNALRKSWRSEVHSNLQTVARLKQKLTNLNAEKDNLVRSMASNPDMADDFKSSIITLKEEIDSTLKEIEKASNIEEDFDHFVQFALEYTDNLRTNWWNLESADDRIRLKLLVYPEGLTISRTGKVLTPRLSPIYRYKTAKKTSENVNFASNISYGGPGET